MLSFDKESLKDGFTVKKYSDDYPESFKNSRFIKTVKLEEMIEIYDLRTMAKYNGEIFERTGKTERTYWISPMSKEQELRYMNQGIYRDRDWLMIEVPKEEVELFVEKKIIYPKSDGEWHTLINT